MHILLSPQLKEKSLHRPISPTYGPWERAIMGFVAMCPLQLLNIRSAYTLWEKNSVLEYSDMLNSSKYNYLAIWHIKRCTTSHSEKNSVLKYNKIATPRAYLNMPKQWFAFQSVVDRPKRAPQTSNNHENRWQKVFTNFMFRQPEQVCGKLRWFEICF